ncbi:Fpg/Nei family DNA glycosylase [Paenibacillus sp. GSMTC-2017]|uniref:Fpg/Nei family DNA glycosylase n=1 Tax=Paenibacillus sp. GSMTC-2017 TaxID=2794350 RepID=UPI001E45A1CA|nr:DNA-formamidopyrimidine glycosylase family protein [Paenibacillus sp. GSMTC-2017]
MQELPELEIYRVMLAERYAGAQITGFQVHNHKITDLSEDQLNVEIIDKTVWFVERRAQHLIFHLDNGRRLVLHISNQAYLYSYLKDENYDSSKASVTMQFGNRHLSFHGLQRGDIQLLTVKGVEEYMKNFGPDPLNKRLSLNKFIEKFAKKRSSLKTALMDQSCIAGIGPVYADEIAYEAGIRPDLKLSEMDAESWEKLFVAMGSILRESISHGGAGQKPLFANDIFTGGYSERFKVIEREGTDCIRCGGTIEKISIGARKAFICPNCQSKPQ